MQNAALMQNAAAVVGWGMPTLTTPTRPWSHSPLDILHQGARVRRIIELDYGHISTPVGGCHRAVTTSLPHVRGDRPASLLVKSVSPFFMAWHLSRYKNMTVDASCSNWPHSFRSDSQ